MYDFLFHCLHGMLDFEIRIFLFSALKIEQYNFKSSPFDPHTWFFPLFLSGTGDIFTHSTNNSLDRVPQYSKSCPTHSLSYMFSLHLWWGTLQLIFLQFCFSFFYKRFFFIFEMKLEWRIFPVSIRDKHLQACSPQRLFKDTATHLLLLKILRIVKFF